MNYDEMIINLGDFSIRIDDISKVNFYFVYKENYDGYDEDVESKTIEAKDICKAIEDNKNSENEYKRKISRLQYDIHREKEYQKLEKLNRTLSTEILELKRALKTIKGLK